MPKPPKKVKIPKVTPPVQPVYDYTKYGQPWQQPLGTTPGARNVPYTVRPNPVIGTPLQTPLTGTPGIGGASKVPWGKLATVGGTLGKLGGWASLLSLPFLALQGREEQLALQSRAEEYARKELGLPPSTPPGAVSTKTEDILAKLGITPAELAAMSKAERDQYIKDSIASGELVEEVTGGEEDNVAVDWDTIIDPDTQMIVAVAKNKAGKIIDYQPTGQFARQPEVESALDKARRLQIEEETKQIGVTKTYAPRGSAPPWAMQDIPETPDVEGWNYYTGEWERNPDYISPGERERMDLERDVFDWQQLVRAEDLRLEREKYGAQLRANPASWLEYATFRGETPKIQSWMLPLMPQQYAGLQADQAIPGYQAGGQTMNLPQLTTPSAQYMSRLDPDQRARYYGYEKARTGLSPSATDWRLFSQAPPGGRYPGLRRTR